MAKLSNILKQLRIENELTQKELAEHLHVSQNAIFNWENDKREPSAEMIERIANYFKVSPAYLMGWDLDQTISINKKIKLSDLMPELELKFSESLKNDTIQRVTAYMTLLTEAGQRKAVEQIELLTKIPEYQKEKAGKALSPDDTSSAPQKNGTAPEPPEVMAAHDRTDVEITSEGRQHDIDLMNDDSNWEQLEQEKPPEE